MSKHINAKKSTIIADSQIHKTDNGSPEVQISILSQEISNLTAHLIKNPKDNSSRRGLLKKVGKRRKLLSFLLGEDVTRYIRTCKKNGIRPTLVTNIPKYNEAIADVAEDVVEA
jgi:small subunit ribosomal protein S15